MSWRSPDVNLAVPDATVAVAQPLQGDATRRINAAWIFRRISPYLGVLAALALIISLLVTMYFTSLDWQWITFFAGVLGAAVVSLATRSIRAEWLIGRLTAQLAAAHQNLVREGVLRASAEQGMADLEHDFAPVHESLPAMLAQVDNQHQFSYCNRAFREGLGAAASRVDGRHLSEVVGSVVYAGMQGDLAAAFGGRSVHRDQLFKSSEGESFRLKLQYLPTFGADSAVASVFLLATDITELGDVAVPVSIAPVVALRRAAPPPPSADDGATERDADATRLRNALSNDEFCLFFQTIEALDTRGAPAPFREILLRLKAEEESMIPPGSFLPVAEEYGMMPDLDRWVTRHLLGWIRVDATRRHAAYSVNLSAQTMADGAFPAFVGQALRDFGLPGSLLCFELQESDLLHWADDAIRLIGLLQPEGCRFAICGFRGNRASFELLRRVPVDFLKIDGSLILNIRRSPVDLARVKAIQRVAKAIGIRTIAEFVEDGETVAQLRGIGVDYAQGFGISRPQDLRQIVTTMLPEVGNDTHRRAAPVGG
jgi:PAS domain S-box-containing protein